MPLFVFAVVHKVKCILTWFNSIQYFIYKMIQIKYMRKVELNTIYTIDEHPCTS